LSTHSTRERLRRPAWLAIGVALVAFAIFEVVVHDLGALPIVVFAVLPDLTFLAGGTQPHERGQLPPRAVPAYNLAHRPVLPLALIAVSLIALLAIRLLVLEPEPFEATRHLPLIALVAGLVWLAHVALDRAFGFGLRTPEGWQRDSAGPG
jgi:Domain of unknown function (DUF4260)